MFALVWIDWVEEMLGINLKKKYVDPDYNLKLHIMLCLHCMGNVPGFADK